MSSRGSGNWARPWDGKEGSSSEAAGCARSPSADVPPALFMSGVNSTSAEVPDAGRVPRTACTVPEKLESLFLGMLDHLGQERRARAQNAGSGMPNAPECWGKRIAAV